MFIVNETFRKLILVHLPFIWNALRNFSTRSCLLVSFNACGKQKIPFTTHPESKIQSLKITQIDNTKYDKIYVL